MIPLDLLDKNKTASPDAAALLEAQIGAGDIQYDQAKANLEDCLPFAGACPAIYMSIDDSLHRPANQALFNRLTVTDADTIDGKPGEPFNILFDRASSAPRSHNCTQRRNLGVEPEMSSV